VEELIFKGTPELETERLVLRKLTLQDDEDVFAYASDDEVTRYVTWGSHQSIEDSRKYINFILGRYENDRVGEWGIELKETGRLIGAMGFVNLDIQNSCRGIGYVLSKDYWGTGVMTEALKRIIQFSFEDMKLNRIEAVHAVENGASGKVMQKAGMSYEGLIRQKLFAKGCFNDVKQYAIVKSDWIEG
jgi:[ribosomal protein S5]-alanine N-acetyltransferase